MRAGPNRFEVELQRRVDNQDAGGLDHTYEPFGEDYASIRALSGRELWAAQQVQAEVTTEIRMRWGDDIDATTRILHYVGDLDDSPRLVDVYDVTVPNPDAKTGRRELVLLCVKRQAEGWRSGPAP